MVKLQEDNKHLASQLLEIRKKQTDIKFDISNFQEKIEQGKQKLLLLKKDLKDNLNHYKSQISNFLLMEDISSHEQVLLAEQDQVFVKENIAQKKVS